MPTNKYVKLIIEDGSAMDKKQTTAEKIKIVIIGECLIELKHTDASHLALSYSGDTFNVARYLAHYANDLNFEIEFVTAVGEDPYSKLFIKNWQKAGIGTNYVYKTPDKMPGLFLSLETKKGNSKNFYYRDNTAAQEIFTGIQTSDRFDALAQTNYVVISSITMAILDDLGRETLLAFLSKSHKYKSLNFYASHDVSSMFGNNKKQGLDFIQRTLVHVDVALCEFKQEQISFHDHSPNKTLQRIQEWGVGEIVLLVDDETCLLYDRKRGKREISFNSSENCISDQRVIEAFNTGYIIGRCQKLSPEKSVAFAQKLANIAKQTKANIIPAKKLPALYEDEQ
jgi:2-dehydro-3-deoxygluconokinase